MSDKNVNVEVSQDNAVLLLEAAQGLELDPSVVATTSFGHFVVPESVAKKAGLDYVDPDADDSDDEEKPVAKKAAAKRAATSKSGE